MARRGGGGSASPRAFIARLGAIVAALPTDAEKREAQAGLSALIGFLTEAQQRLQALPSSEDLAEVRKAADTLEALFGKAERDPILAGVLGLRRPAPAPRGSSLPVPSGDDRVRTQAILRSLEALPGDEIKSELLSEDRHTGAELRALAAEMGLRTSARMGREALAQQITTRIVNDRGYRALRGGQQNENGAAERT